MLTRSQWVVVAIFAILVFLLFFRGGPIAATILGLPFLAIVSFFYWRQGKRRS